ncbi:MAG: M1 family metallopeptidase [Pyrinomonadaceae bacterium]
MSLARRAAIFALFISVATLSTFAQRRERPVDSWKPLHYGVDLSFNDQLNQISARADILLEVMAQNLTKVDFDFGELPIDSVLVAGANAKFERTPETLNVMLTAPAKRGDKLNVTVNYHGHPKDGLIFAKDADGKMSATGDNWPNRVHYWIPTLDHPSAKATVTFTVSAPQRYEVLANGKFITLIGNAATSHWKFEETKPIPPYCMVVAVNEGAIINSPDYATTNLLYNVPERDRDYASKGFSPAAPALALYSQTIAAYPYEKLALIIGATQFGGMENSSAIVFPSNLFSRRANDRMSARFGVPARIEEVVAHEIAHQWFGDSVTESTWADLWLSEGFATYFAGLFVEKYDGEDAFHEYMRNAAQKYFNYEKQTKTPIHDEATTDLMKLLNPNNYEKGAWVLHMLRSQLGDEAFFKGLRNYYNAHVSANASTDDLRGALEKASGKNLKEFFAQWVYRTGHPRYRALWEVNGDGTALKITVSQLQDGEAFLDPLPIEITVDGAKVRQMIYPKSKIATLTIPLKGKLSATEFDPDETLLKEVVK